MREVKTAFVAPGQGIKSWDTGLRLLDESDKTAMTYEQVYEATGIDIVDVCSSNQPINNPAIVQPAALGIGYAQAEVLQERRIMPDYLIGLSAGEFTVAAISGALTVKEAAYIAQQRGIYQSEEAGGMGSAVTALHRRPLDTKVILHDLDAWIANVHAPTITGFGYRKGSYKELIDRLMDQGAKVVDTGIPFPPHGDIVKKAQERLAKLIESRGDVRDATVQIISMRTARAMKKARTIKHNLIWQTTQATQLNRAVTFAINNGVEDIYDLGPGDSITKLLGAIVSSPNIRINPVTT